MKISASFLSSKNKAKDLEKLNLTTIDYIHLDFMDGKFVPQKSLSVRELKKIYKYTSKRLDVHLMVKKPAKYIKKFISLNTEFITFHVEVQEDIHKLINLIHKYGVKAGLAIKPDTDIELLKEYLDEIDLILVMSVEPGKGGQEFIKTSTEKIISIKKMLHELGKTNILVSVDGGINDETKELVSHADILVSGSYITKSNNFQEAIDNLKYDKVAEKMNPLELKEELESIGKEKEDN